jgi:hypothetical protein
MGPRRKQTRRNIKNNQRDNPRHGYHSQAYRDRPVGSIKTAIHSSRLSQTTAHFALTVRVYVAE